MSRKDQAAQILREKAGKPPQELKKPGEPLKLIIKEELNSYLPQEDIEKISTNIIKRVKEGMGV